MVGTTIIFFKKSFKNYNFLNCTYLKQEVGRDKDFKTKWKSYTVYYVVLTSCHNFFNLPSHHPSFQKRSQNLLTLIYIREVIKRVMIYDHIFTSPPTIPLFTSQNFNIFKRMCRISENEIFFKVIMCIDKLLGGS